MSGRSREIFFVPYEWKWIRDERKHAVSRSCRFGRGRVPRDWNKAIRKLPYVIPAVSESSTKRNGTARRTHGSKPNAIW